MNVVASRRTVGPSPLDGLAVGQLLHLDLPGSGRAVAAIIVRFGPPELAVIADCGDLVVSAGEDAIASVYLRGRGEIMFETEVLGEDIVPGGETAVRLAWPSSYLEVRS